LIQGHHQESHAAIRDQQAQAAKTLSNSLSNASALALCSGDHRSSTGFLSMGFLSTGLPSMGASGQGLFQVNGLLVNGLWFGFLLLLLL
jgi:hypothetical protein